MSFGSTGKRNANEPVLFPLPYFIPRLVLPTSPKSPDSFLSCIFKKKLFTEDIFSKGKEDEEEEEDEMSCLKVRVHARLYGNEEMKTNEKTPLRRGRDIPFQ